MFAPFLNEQLPKSVLRFLRVILKTSPCSIFVRSFLSLAHSLALLIIGAMTLTTSQSLANLFSYLLAYCESGPSSAAIQNVVASVWVSGVEEGNQMGLEKIGHLL